jgi:hypothetical protein
LKAISCLEKEIGGGLYCPYGDFGQLGFGHRHIPQQQE